ncbi:MAG: hypothetical protein ABW026_17160 [Microvirga sp.]
MNESMPQVPSVHRFRVGDEIQPLRKKTYQRLLDEVEFVPDSIHTDDYSVKLGYPGALVSAYVFTGYLSEMMLATFGLSWFETGDYELAFVGKGVQQNDLLTFHARIGAIEPEGGGLRLRLEVWGEKDDGAKPIVGRASAVFREDMSVKER